MAQVVVSQCADPVRVSFVGHLAGAVAALLLLQGDAGARGQWGGGPGAGRSSASRWRHAPRAPQTVGLGRLAPALAALLRLLPLHAALWWLGRRAVLAASSSRGSSAPRPATDWPAAFRAFRRAICGTGGWRAGAGAGICGGAAARAAGAGPRWGLGGASAPRFWGSGAWGHERGGGFVGRRVRVVGLQQQTLLNGRQVAGLCLSSLSPPFPLASPPPSLHVTLSLSAVTRPFLSASSAGTHPMPCIINLSS